MYNLRAFFIFEKVKKRNTVIFSIAFLKLQNDEFAHSLIKGRWGLSPFGVWM